MPVTQHDLPITRSARAPRIPLSPFGWLLVCLLPIVMLRVLAAHGVPSPFIFSDELIYTKLARSLDEAGTLQLRGTFYNFPTILYAIALMPAEAVANPHLAYRLVQLTNACLITLSAVPTYWLGRRLLAPRASLALALMTQALPVTLYANVAMAESLFFPLFMTTAWLVLAGLEHDGRRWKLALGLALGLIFMTKPQGLLLPAAVVAAALASWSPASGLGGLGRRLLSFWPTIAVFVAFLLAHVLRINWMMHSGHPFDLRPFFGTYSGGLGGDAVRPFSLAVCLHSVAGNLGAIAMAVGYLPLPLFAVFAARTLRAGQPTQRAFLAFTLAFGLLALWSTGRLAAQFDDPNRIHERYTFYLEPLVLAGALVVLARWRGAVWPLVVGAIAALVASSAFFGQVLATSAITDSPTYAAIWRASLRLAPGAIMALAVGLGSAFLLGLGGLLASGRKGWIPPALGTYALGLSAMALIGQAAVSHSFASRFAYADWVQAQAKGQPTLVLIDDGQIFLATFIADFFARQTVLPYHLRYNPDKSTHLGLTLDAHGELAELSRLPDGTPIAAGSSGLLLDQRVIARADDHVVYAKHGPVHLMAEGDWRGRREDGWTDGHFTASWHVRDARLHGLHAVASLDTRELPQRLLPYPLTLQEGPGRTRTVWLRERGDVTVPCDVTPQAGSRFSLAMSGPTWVPAIEHRFADPSSVAFKLRWIALTPEVAWREP